jgi:flagellar motor switch protein FliM
MFLRGAFADMKEAWTPIANIDVEYLNSEINPNFAGIVTPSEVVVVCPFQIDLDGGGGALHIVLPYSMIEPLREVLDSGVQADRAEQDERWLASLKEGLQDAEVELTTVLGGAACRCSGSSISSPATCCPVISPARPPCSPKACRCSAARSACRAASNASVTTEDPPSRRPRHRRRSSAQVQ